MNNSILISKATKIVENFMTLFQSDFYDYDLKNFENSNNFIWSLRTTGTDVTNLENLWNDEFLNKLELNQIESHIKVEDFLMYHARNVKYYHVCNGKLIKKSISQIETIFDNAVRNKILELTISKQRELTPNY